MLLKTGHNNNNNNNRPVIAIGLKVKKAFH